MQKIIHHDFPAAPGQAAALKNRLQWLFFLRVVSLSILLGINILLQSTERVIIVPPLNYIAYFIAGVYIFTVSSALLLKFIRHSTFAYTQILVDSVLVSILVFYSGGSQSIFTPFFFFPIISGSFILLRMGGLAAAAASTLGYGSVLVLEYLGRYPIFFNEFWYKPLENWRIVLNFFSINGLSFFLAAILSAMLSERLRKTEKALNQTSLQFDSLTLLYKQIFDDITTGIITVDNAGNISSMNPAAETISGYAADQVLNRNISEIFPNFKMLAREKARPIVYLDRQGEGRIPVAYSCSKLNMPQGCEDCQIITLQDLSEIKKMEEQVRQSEKLATIGQMAAGIAHEFRNPLAAISGSAEVLKNEMTNNPTNALLMDIIVRECSRLETHISDFLQFSKPAVPEKELIQLKGVVEEVLHLLNQTRDWQKSCKTIIDIPENLDCLVDIQQLTQVLINLLHNSCMALTGEKGEIRITAREFAREDHIEMTQIIIHDNGPGIPEKVLARVFDPFYTTRENGTGLGLAIVRQIIDSHEGTIDITSSASQGTAVTITLPLP